jgi:serine phosphatase RsbU (regulator of sigma subunit)
MDGESAREIRDAVLLELKDFVDDTPQNDDITMVVLKVV